MRHASSFRARWVRATAPRPRCGVLVAGLLSLSLPVMPLMGQVSSAGDPPSNPLDEPLLPPVRATSPGVVAPADRAVDHDLDPGDPLDGEVRDRLLKLRGGAVLRVSSRKVDGHWEIKQSGAWTELPAGVVESARLEHRVMREMRERRDAVGRDDTVGLLELARWDFSEGLGEEGLRILDQILEEDPDHAGALLLLAEPGLPFGLPRASADAAETRRDLLDYARQAPRSIQELVIRKLSQVSRDDEGQEALKEELARRMRSPNIRERAFSALAARRLYPEGIALKELLRRTVLDPSPEVRTSAALALRDTGEEGLVLPLIRALESSSSMVRTHAARSLGTMGFAASVEPLALRLATLRTSSGGDGYRAPAGNVFVGRQVSFVQDFEPEIANSAVIAAPVIGVAQEGATLDVRVHGVSSSAGGPGLSYSYATETKSLRQALAQITAAEVRDSNSAWREWWNTYGQDWVAKNLPDRDVESGSLVGGDDR